jgi:hypothetical protein
MSSSKKNRPVSFYVAAPLSLIKTKRKKIYLFYKMPCFLLECGLERLYQGALSTDQAAGLPVVKPVFVPHAAAILERLAGVAGRVEEVS